MQRVVQLEHSSIQVIQGGELHHGMRLQIVRHWRELRVNLVVVHLEARLLGCERRHTAKNRGGENKPQCAADRRRRSAFGRCSRAIGETERLHGELPNQQPPLQHTTRPAEWDRAAAYVSDENYRRKDAAFTSSRGLTDCANTAKCRLLRTPGTPFLSRQPGCLPLRAQAGAAHSAYSGEISRTVAGFITPVIGDTALELPAAAAARHSFIPFPSKFNTPPAAPAGACSQAIFMPALRRQAEISP